jgi:hypothetical protein
VATGRQATGTYRANVTETKYADAHRIYLFVIEDVHNHANNWPEFMFASVTDATEVERIDADLPRTGMLNSE